ncbi:hypothetical protein GMLC_05030 [Geomonas limicola]|uniref:Uncharacterized protein n=1 Tax=Geomonas limicola TaxID=2740186 RepID=A0A6V8N4N8_9BACT|nr:L,D-transpeptidase family protein [Geomonas limicola]GFO66924.1 hypothetical protein GMLC_05030 [Geomonas limicola]
MRLIVLSVLILLLGTTPARSASRSEALIILNNLMEEGASTRHPESFKVLIETYFAGVKCLEEKQPELAAKYFALVEKYGKILAPYFLTLQPGQQLITPSRNKAKPVPAAPLPIPGPASPQAVRSQEAQLSALGPQPALTGTGTGAATAAPEAHLPPVVPPKPAGSPVSTARPAAATTPSPVAAAEPAATKPPQLPAPGPAASSPLHPIAVVPPLAPSRGPLPAAPAPLPANAATAVPDVEQQVRAESPEEDGEDELVEDAPTESAGQEGSRPEPQLLGRVLGGETLYRVRPNDTLLKIAARFKIKAPLLARLNRLTLTSLLREGQTLRIVNRRIVPSPLDQGLVINIADCTLYCFKDGKLTRTVPIAVGRAELKQNRSWQTPLGSFTVVDKVKNPSWRVPISIQKEMEQQGKEVKALVPPGPENPLGKYALRTSLPGILIHGTNRPSSISSYSSHGCIRVSPANIELLYNEVPVNTAGKIVYRPVKVAVSEGKTYLEVHKDIYGKLEDLEREARNLLAAAGSTPIDWRKVRRMVQEQTGVAEEVTRVR